MSKIILPIKPHFVRKIFDGTKRVEYRKKIPCRKDVTHVIIYATAPISKIVGEFELKGIICESPEELWDITKEIGGIKYDEYSQYFTCVKQGYAMQVGNVIKFPVAKPLSEYGISAVPQNFIYVY